MSVECPQCSTSNSDDSLYCTACGQLLVPYEREEPIIEEPAQIFASRTSRLGAALIDGVIAGAAFLVVYFSPTTFLILLLAVLTVQVMLLTRDGQSLGKKALNIRIVVYHTGENGGFVPNVLLRGLVNGLLGFIPFYGPVDILFIFRNDRRCIHDLIAGTVVVNA